VKPAKPVLLLLVLLIFVVFNVIGISAQPYFPLRLSDYAALAVYGGVVALLANFLISERDGRIELDLLHPVSLFAAFYFLYYFVTGWLSVITDSKAHHHSFEISAMVLVCFLSFLVGDRLSKRKAGTGETKASFELGQRTAGILLAFCVAGSILLVWYYGWRISIGQFYTHVGYVIAPTTVLANFLEGIVDPMQLPTVLILGLVMRARPNSAAIRRFFYVYVAGSVLIYLLSSQFRLVVTVVLFAIASINIARRQFLGFGAYVAGGTLALLSLLGILLIRSQAVTGENQLTGAATAVVGGSVHSEDASNTLGRSLAQPLFLSEIMDKVEDGYPFLNGDVILSMGYSLIPRVFWPQKPIVTPMQLLLRSEFNMELHDDSPGPMVEFYSNGGWPGVIAGFLVMGWVSGVLTLKTAKNPALLLVLLLCWWWSIVCFMEQEVVISLLSVLRTIAVVWLTIWMFRAVTGKRARHLAKVAGASLLMPLLFLRKEAQ